MATYVLSNFKHLLEENSNCQLLFFHYPVNKEAPFSFDSLKNSDFIVYQKNNFEYYLKLSTEFNPDLIICSGWSNKDYLKIIQKANSKTKKVLCFDNQWTNSLKQQVFSMISKFTFLSRFDYAFVAGEPQKKYALKLGFKETQVFKGLYVADVDLFSKIGQQKLSHKHAFPKILISVARYVPQKDLKTLWKAFINVNAMNNNSWKLYCFGQGELFDERIEHSDIVHFGFKQAKELEPYILESGVYVLPSLYEPWGVAVQEMALSATPLILSHQVGAASQFLNSKNGFLFEAGIQSDLESKLDTLMKMNDDELWEMAENSYQIGLTLNHQIWIEAIKNMLKN